MMGLGLEKGNYESTNLRNVLIISCGFMLIIGTWRTTAAIQQTIIKSVQVDDPTFTGDGFLSQAIINGVFSLSNFIASTILSVVGVRTTLFFGSCLYAVFIASFLYPNAWLMYVCSGCIGFGAANVWVAYGTYITRCSTKDNIGTYMAISWTIVSIGQLLGSTFVFFKFQGMNHIDHDTRLMVALILTCVAILGSLTFLFLQKRRAHETGVIGAKQLEKSNKTNILTSLSQPLRLLANKHFLLLIPTAMYNGLELAFAVAIYPTSVAFSESFGGDVRKLAGVSGILVALGSLTGGLLFGIFLSRFVKSKRTFMMKTACTAHCTAFLLMYLNLSDGSSLGPTLDTSWINPPSVIVAMVCAYLLGIGNACVCTQMSAAIGVIWRQDPSPALSMYRFFQGATCAGGFFLGTLVGFYILLLIISTVTLVGTITFHISENLIVKMEEKTVKHGVPEVNVIPPKKIPGVFTVSK